ncbi:MAG: DUF3800 domain-containing protein [Anaerolineaceae bacterium]|nr:DUF3800 domain-containing protein [bacterium]MBQ4513684.1 DUF3800 domain-containing protein [Anaerolineaceae bacterium]
MFGDYYAFIDESGNLDTKSNDNMLVISAIVTDDRVSLARAMRSAEKKIRSINKKSSGELKAAYQQPITRKKVLTQLIRTEFSIYSIVFDLKTISNSPYSWDEIYRVGMSMLCCQIYSQHRNTIFILDKRYTKEVLRARLNENIRELIYCNYKNEDEIPIFHSDSIEYAELRAADFIVYETYQKHRFGSELFTIVDGRIKKETIYHDTTWEKIKKESKTPSE